MDLIGYNNKNVSNNARKYRKRSNTGFAGILNQYIN